MDTRLLLFNCLYEARNPSLYQSLAITCDYTHRDPPLLHLEDTLMSTFDYLSLGYFLPWVCRTVSSEISVCLVLINDTCTKFLLKGLTEGLREAKSCGGGTYTVGSLPVQLYCWELESCHYLTQLLQSSEGINVSELKLYNCQLTHQDFLHLAEVVGRSTSLKVLNVELTRESTDTYSANGIVYLIEALKHNSTLQKLTLSNILTVQQLELLANTLTINTTLEELEYVEDFLSETELSALAKRLWVSGVLYQLLTIAIERTAKQFGEEETIRALKTILLKWKWSTYTRACNSLLLTEYSPP